MKILIAIDGSHFSHRAARFGALLAGVLNAECQLLGVAETNRDKADLERLLAELAPVLDLDPPPETKLRTGKPVDEILAESAATDASLLVVGARGRSMVGRWFLGDTALQLVGRSAIPVVIVRRSRPVIRKVLVCTAGGEGGRKDTEYAAMIAAKAGAQMVILHVMSQVALQPGGKESTSAHAASWHIEQGTTEGRHLEELVEIAHGYGVVATPRIRHGLVVDEISAEARGGDYDLVTVGAHQGSGLMRFLLDDLTADIIGRLNRPVLIVR